MTNIKTISLDDVGKEFSLRFVPNVYKPASSLAATTYAMPGKHINLTTSVFSYVMEDGKIVVYRFGLAINKMLDICRRGYYGTPDGRFVAPSDHEEKVTKYYATEDLSHITLDKDQFKDQSYIDEYQKRRKLLEFNDVVLYEPNIANSLTSGLILEFKVDSIAVPGFDKPLVKICGLRWTKGEPLYKVGDDKNKILDAYGQIISLETAVEEFVQDMKSKYPEMLFNEDAKKARMNWLKEQANK